ncbi:MAG: hypothetical protein ACLT1W_13910 [Alistipes onderdonkii]
MTPRRFTLPFPVDPQRTVCFSGYRIGKMPGTAEGCDPDEVQRIVRKRCAWIVERLCERGYDTFVSGMATFDLWRRGGALGAACLARHPAACVRPYREQAKHYPVL